MLRSVNFSYSVKLAHWLSKCLQWFFAELFPCTLRLSFGKCWVTALPSSSQYLHIPLYGVLRFIDSHQQPPPRFPKSYGWLLSSKCPQLFFFKSQTFYLFSSLAFGLHLAMLSGYSWWEAVVLGSNSGLLCAKHELPTLWLISHSSFLRTFLPKAQFL